MHRPRFSIFARGLLTGLFVELAIGPVFLLIMDLTLQRTVWDGIAGAVAATIVDYFYLAMAVYGVAQLLRRPRWKLVVGLCSACTLAGFGIVMASAGVHLGAGSVEPGSMRLGASFVAVFFLTLSSPMTIVFNSSVFATQTLAQRYDRTQMLIFAVGYGLSTFLSFSLVAGVFSLLRLAIPLVVVQALNVLVGCVLIGFGVVHAVGSLRAKV